MSSKFMTALVALGLLAIALTAQVQSQDQPGAAADVPPPGELVCHLDRASATPGQTVRLTELFRADHKDTVREVWHWTVRVGRYDKQTGRLKNLKPEHIVPILGLGDDPFENLFGNTTMAGDRGAMLWNVQTPRVKGFETEFRAKLIGTYLIYTKWEFTTTRQQVESSPVLLTVRPPRDAQGRTVVKAEWLERDEP